jgi:hypothetical protein
MNHERINDFFRFLIDHVIGVSGVLFKLATLLKIKLFPVNQLLLKYRYRLHKDTPIRGYDDATVYSVESRYVTLGRTAIYAYTSGSTNRPKKIAYDQQRVKQTRSVFINAFFRYLSKLPKNRTLFIFSSFDKDQSLTSLLSKETELPPYLCGLQAPHRVQNHPIFKRLSKLYGDTAVRFWILAVSNPGMIYATNPSTISMFFHELYNDWEKSSALIKEHISHPLELENIYERIASSGSIERMQKIATTSVPLPISDLFPGLQGFACWDGGYVGPFIEAIRHYLPSNAYKHFPMYSMSTETIETIPGLSGFHPMAPGVFYEFIEEVREDAPSNLVCAKNLIPGKIYSMVVSDDYGLKRYQTEDMFECVALVQGMPDLRFLCRRNLSYSFTGEKLTAEQLSLAFKDAQSHFPELHEGFLTCFPSKASEKSVPSYCVVYVFNDVKPECKLSEVVSHVQERLKDYNYEFKSKIESRRLGKLKSEAMPLKDFMRHLSGTNSKSQIKILPMYTKLWENFRTQ